MTESTNGTDMVQLSTESVTVTDVTSANENETVQVKDVTPIETTIRDQGMGVSSLSTITDSVTVFDFTNATLYKTSSEQSTDFASPLITGTTVKLETEISPDVHTTDQSFSNNSRSFTTSITSTNTAAPSATQLQTLCHDSTTIAIVAGVSAVVVLLVLVTSLVCFFRLRHKWRTKIQLERKKTDIWSMATFNNTIINENFNDYQLASTTNDVRKSSAFSENSIRIYDPFSGFAPHTQLSYDNDSAQPTDKFAPEFQADDSTLRRNTFSAPSGLNKALSKQHSVNPNDKRFTSRDRSSTFTVGKKPKTDQHVLLSHEELVEGSTPEHIGALYTTPTHSYHVTEL